MSSPAVPVSARDIVTLLERRHSKDLFVPECKDGPTHGGTHARLDAWALRKSYTQPCSWGYEVKVSRGDFLRDEKWQHYLSSCHQFYFVTPYKLIQPEEVPEGAGLIWTSRNATRLYTKRKAPHRDIEMPVDLLLYILISRTRIVGSFAPIAPNRGVAFWKAWLEEKREGARVGYMVSRRIRDLHRDLIAENDRLARQMREYDRIRETLRVNGFDPDTVGHWSVERRLSGRDRDALASDLRRLRGSVDTAIRALEGSEP